jgi:hypothetical protein
VAAVRRFAAHRKLNLLRLRQEIDFYRVDSTLFPRPGQSVR